MSRALIIVDIQNDFLPGGSLEVGDGDSIIDYVVSLMKESDRYELVDDIRDRFDALRELPCRFGMRRPRYVYRLITSTASEKGVQSDNG